MIEKIFIRADANEIIGTGHIMRCIAIANKVKELGVEVVFIVADTRSYDFVSERGFGAICMNTIWNDLDSEIQNIKKIIEERNIKRILVDDYFVTEKYLLELNKMAEIIYIDDMDYFIYPCKTLINYNIYAQDIGYETKYKDNGIKTEFLLGTLYAPIREEFSNIEPRNYQGVKNILITSGGTDNYNMIGNILDRLEKQSDFYDKNYYCVIGEFNVNKVSLFEKYGLYNNIHLLYNICNISDYMKMCEVCVTAGGTTIYELCACGTPSIMYSLADNQLNCAHKVSELDLIPWVGDIRFELTDCIENIIIEIERLENKERWENVSKQMQQYVDGNGAMRIANKIIDG